MKDYLPGYYRDSRQMNAIIESEGEELESLDENRQAVEDQFTIQRATWKLQKYEEIFAVVPESNETIEAKRARLLAHQRKRSPSTRKEFERLLTAYADQVDIVEYFSEYLVEFILEDMKISLAKLDGYLIPIMPAHLDWKLKLIGSFQFGTILYDGNFQFSSNARKSESLEGFGFSDLAEELGGSFRIEKAEIDNKRGFSSIHQETGGFFGGQYMKGA